MVLIAALVALARADEPGAGDARVRYVLDYPAARGFCPPVASYFEDVSTAVQRVRGRTFRHQLNGGYGLPVQMQVGGQNLLHLGADVAWHRQGDRVYAIADGVVRMSEGPAADAKADKGSKRGADDDDPAAPARGGTLEWGNVIAIEHRLADGSYVTSVYGHLAQQRLVAVGDIVRSGELIGAIGRPGVENGGYKAHLHFAILTGREAEPGCPLFMVQVGGERAVVTLAALGADELEVESKLPLPARFEIAAGPHKFTVSERDGKHWLPAEFLHHLRRPDWAVVGYGLSTKGFADPTEFLREHAADIQPAAYEETTVAKKIQQARREKEKDE